MHFGLFNLMTQRERSQTASEIIANTTEHVKMAEQIGFEIAWFAEHHFSNYCLCPSPLTMCAFTAPQTKKIRLGPAVVVAPLYEPVRLLEDICLVDQLSGSSTELVFLEALEGETLPLQHALNEPVIKCWPGRRVAHHILTSTAEQLVMDVVGDSK